MRRKGGGKEEERRRREAARAFRGLARGVVSSALLPCSPLVFAASLLFALFLVFAAPSFSVSPLCFARGFARGFRGLARGCSHSLPCGCAWSRALKSTAAFRLSAPLLAAPLRCFYSLLLLAARNS